MRPRRSIFPNSRDRDETETFNLQDRVEKETFQKTSQDRLETETFKTETRSLKNRHSSTHPVESFWPRRWHERLLLSVDEHVDPCTSHRCLFGARCVPASDARTATCRCDWRCDDHLDTPVCGQGAQDYLQNRCHNETPVCGQDGKDYLSECHLRQSNCLAMAHVEVKYNGSCGI